MNLASRPPLWRIAEIDRLVRLGEHPNAVSLARELEVCRRTVQRDLDFLRDRLKAPLEFVASRRGYRYTDPTFRLSFWNLTEGELLALFLADGVLRRYRDTPFGPDLERAIAKVVGGLEEEVRVDLGALAEAFSSHESAGSEIAAPLFEALTRSFRRSERLRIVYDSGGRGVETTQEVDPYTLATVGGSWYLVAFCHLREEVRMFTPSRIRSVKATGARFERPADFRLGEYLATSFGVLRGEPGASYSIRLRFTGDAARHVRGRKWHLSQTLEDAGEGVVVLGLELSHLREAERWALSWMPECEVLAPEELRERVERACGEGWRNNRADEARLSEVEELAGKGSKKRKRESS
jgi:predicted DNA-binding transcriptional regulator YafY